MISLAVGLLLIISLLLAHIWVRSEPLKRESPLDVDSRLPLPWIGHASSVFSLTALFGAYMAILVIVGPGALLGVATGGIASLVFLRKIIRESHAESFESFLGSRRFSVDPQYNESLFFLLAVTQIGFATSEVVILRDLAVHAFVMTPHHATVFAISVALIAYLYSLVGGYGAVFRTDILQFGFIALMCIVIAVMLVPRITVDNFWSITQPLRSDYWTFGLAMPAIATRTLNFCVGFLTGACFLAASPDTWKRVFLTSRNQRYSSFPILLIAGGLPFVLLLPAAMLIPKQPLDIIGPFDILYQAGQGRFLLLAVTLGMISAFLSSFDSALVSATHVLLANKKRNSGTPNNLSSFHYTIGMCFSVIIAGALVLLSALGNAYFLAAFLLSLYAILGGTILGTRGLSRPASTGSIPWMAICILLGWFIYLVNMPGVLQKPSPLQIKTFPIGMVVFVLYFIYSYVRSRRRPGDS